MCYRSSSFWAFVILTLNWSHVGVYLTCHAGSNSFWLWQIISSIESHTFSKWMPANDWSDENCFNLQVGDITRKLSALVGSGCLSLSQCPDSACKQDLLAYLQRIALYCHQLNICSKVKAEVQNLGGELVVSGVCFIICCYGSNVC